MYLCSTQSQVRKHVHLDIWLTTFYRTKTSVDRNIKQSGVMLKDDGQQSSYGIAYEMLPTLTLSKSVKAQQKRP